MRLEQSAQHTQYTRVLQCKSSRNRMLRSPRSKQHPIQTGANTRLVLHMCLLCGVGETVLMSRTIAEDITVCVFVCIIQRRLSRVCNGLIPVVVCPIISPHGRDLTSYGYLAGTGECHLPVHSQWQHLLGALHGWPNCSKCPRRGNLASGGPGSTAARFLIIGRARACLHASSAHHLSS